MPTSLAEQLNRLAVPQSSVYTRDKKQPSLLFDPKVAALKNRETFYEIGLSGLQELISLNEQFVRFENTLFSSSSKDFERAVQTKETNEKLDDDIRSFLMQLSPYFMLQSCHKTLEWLINRFHIQDYNQNDIFMLILPYHETKIFVRFLQLLKIDNVQHTWNWLLPLQKSGISLAKSVLLNHAKTDLWFLKFVSKMTVKAIDVLGDNASSLTTLFSFYCMTNIGVLSSLPVITEGHMSAIIPTLLKALSSPVKDFKASGIMILAQLVSKVHLKRKTLQSFIRKLTLSESDLSYDTVLLLHLIYNSQTSLSVVSEEMLNDFSSEQMTNLAKVLNDLLRKRIDVSPLMICLLKGILKLLPMGVEKFKRYKDFPEILLLNVDLNDEQAETILKCILNSFPVPTKDKLREDSDLELVQENDPLNNVEQWYTLLLKRISIKYPNVMDALIKSINQNADENPEILQKLKKILSFHSSIAHNMGNSNLFTELCHYNASNRIEAINYIINEFERLKTEDHEFVFNSIIERLNDDNPNVVMAIFKLNKEDLIYILSHDIPSSTDILLHLLKRGHKDAGEWQSMANLAVEILFSIDCKLDVNTIVSVVPFLFPEDEDSVDITLKLLQSNLISKCSLFEMSSKVVNSMKAKSAESISAAIFNIIESNQWLKDLEDPLSELNVKNVNCTDLMVYVLLKTNLLRENISPTDSLAFLNEVLSASGNYKLTVLKDENNFSTKLINNCFRKCKQNKFPVQLICYALKGIIHKSAFKYSPEKWFSLENNSDETKLITKLFDLIIAGCNNTAHLGVYVPLMNTFMDKLCPDLKDKFLFLTNFAMGHTVKNCGSFNFNPELQLRSLKLISSLISLVDNSTWIFDLNILLGPLLSLNCVHLQIRSEALKIINLLVQKSGSRAGCYFHLLRELNDRSEELLLDNEQLPLILYTLLSQDASVKSTMEKSLQIQMKKCLSDIIEKLPQFPLHLIAALLSVLVHIDSKDILSTVLNISSLILIDYTNKTKIQSVYDFNIIKLVISRINANALRDIDDGHPVWNLISFLLDQQEQAFPSEKGGTYSACSIFLKEFDENCFEKLPPNLSKSLIHKICKVGTFGNNTPTILSASKFIKRVNLSSNDFIDILKGMISIKESTTPNAKRQNKSPAVPSISVIDTKEWKCGVTVLEYVQNKKKIKVDYKDIPVLFKVLKRCLEFEEQSALEYVKQLSLSCILHWCQICITIDTLKKNEISESAFDIELIVKCIRGTQNPQTHHHALVLLVYLADILPNQVLHHTMAIFTFIGSSVLRHDDAYSFQIISKIIETVIPVLTKFNGNIEDHSEESIDALRRVVVPVLRIFVDAVLDVPEHRRLPLYTKLMDTLGSPHFLWIFSALLLETHILHDHEERRLSGASRMVADAEKPISRVEFGVSLFCEFPANIILQNITKLISYLQSLPIERKEENLNAETDPAEIFSIPAHTAKQLRHFRYSIISFLNILLTSPMFQYQINKVENQAELENNYRFIIVHILTFIQFVSKTADQNALKPQGKYWKVMLHHSYEVMENVNNQLSANMFVVVIRGLLTHNLLTVQRKSMEILNTKLQHNAEFFSDCDETLMRSLLEPLLVIVRSIGSIKPDHASIQEYQVIQQTALLSLKLLTRLLCHADPEPFKEILSTVTEVVRSERLDGNVMASVVLCLAELCTNLKAHAISSLPKLMPCIINVFKQQRKMQTPELILLSVVTAVYKIVESLPLFLSPYLGKIVFELSILFAKWTKSGYDSAKVSPVIVKLQIVRSKIATAISPRVLVPLVHRCYDRLIEKQFYEAVGPLMALVAENFSVTGGSDLSSLIQEVTSLFLIALQLRSDTAENDKINPEHIDHAEEEIVKALVSLVLKFSETSFRPFYFKIYDWALRSNVDNHKHRAITFYRLSHSIADSLKGLFVLFAGHFIKNAAEMLDHCNMTKTDALYFESKEKCRILVEYILKTLHTVFLYDSQNFINKEKFETLMQPIVDQIENTLDDTTAMKIRAKSLIIPCVAQFAVATADDSLWKQLNYQILLKTRHSESAIRLLAVDCLVSTANRLGQGWLPLLAESVPFLSELMEDDDSEVEEAAKNAIRELERVLGEPLQKYF